MPWSPRTCDFSKFVYFVAVLGDYYNLIKFVASGNFPSLIGETIPILMGEVIDENKMIVVNEL